MLQVTRCVQGGSSTCVSRLGTSGRRTSACLGQALTPSFPSSDPSGYHIVYISLHFCSSTISIMAEFTIKDEDLNSLKGKVAIVTGMLLHSTALRGIRDHI